MFGRKLTVNESSANTVFTQIAIALLSKLGRNQHAELVLYSLENDTIGLKIVKDKEVILNAIES